MNKKQICVPGKPRGKGRPRFSNKGKYVQIYTDDKTLEYEEKIVREWVVKYGKGNGFGDSTVGMIVKAFFPIPKNTSKKMREKMLNGKILPTKKPDIDNIIKICMDALNGVAYSDDKLLTKVIGVKQYSETPRVEIIVGEINNDK